MAVEQGKHELNKSYEILVCTGELLFRGSFSCNFSQRLIDALNEGVRESPQLKVVDFLPMNNVSMIGVNGHEKKFTRIYLSKSNIIFVAQVSGEIKGKKLNAYPYRRKLPLGVTIYATQIFTAQVFASTYVLKGQLYVETWGHVADTLEAKDRFIPLTQVEVDPALPDGSRQFDFVAVNKERVISICEGTEGA